MLYLPLKIYIPNGRRTESDLNNTQWAIELSYHYRQAMQYKSSRGLLSI